jgi:hypothetical protein
MTMVYSPVKRVVVCVDGTWYDPNGLITRREGNNSNIYRIYSSIKQGTFVQDNRAVKQVAHYETGVGLDKQLLDSFNDSITTSQEACDNQVNRIFTVWTPLLFTNDGIVPKPTSIDTLNPVLLPATQRSYRRVMAIWLQPWCLYVVHPVPVESSHHRCRKKIDGESS